MTTNGKKNKQNPFAESAGFICRNSKNKIVQRFYETPAPLKAGRDLINDLNSSRAAPKVGISVSLQQAAGNSNLKY
jgi:hypothetical protein